MPWPDLTPGVVQTPPPVQHIFVHGKYLRFEDEPLTFVSVSGKYLVLDDTAPEIDVEGKYVVVEVPEG